MGKMVDGRSDIYAVGVMLYEMLLGFPPFDGADSYSVGYKHVHETAATPDVVDSRVPPELSALVMRCLSKPADARYQTGYGPRRRPAVVLHDGRGIRRAALGLVCPTRRRSPRNARLIRFATPT